MTEPVSFRELVTALRDSFTAARTAAATGSPGSSSLALAELTVSLRGTLYESPHGLGLRLGRPLWRRRRALQLVEIRLHGAAPVVTEISINGERL